jgi:hypothetical protein
LLFAGPEGIGSAFHGAEDAEKQNPFIYGGFPQNDALFYNCLTWTFAATAFAAEWFFTAAYQSRPVWRGLSAAMKKNILII